MTQQVNRRGILCFTASVLAAGSIPATAAVETSDGLVWQPRSSVPVKAQSSSYAPRFVTYLARFLLNFDAGSAAWWAEQGQRLPSKLSRDELAAIRQKSFGQFSESVEVGLLKYQGRTGVRNLFSLLRSRYGSSAQAKIQLALLFSLISASNQPVDKIERALGEVEQGAIKVITLTNPGSGYTNRTPPAVLVSAPAGGGPAPLVQAVLSPTGRVAGITLTGGGSGYLSSPAVSISPPLLGGVTAQAFARVESGRIVAIELTEPGSGYSSRDDGRVQVIIEPPRDDNDVPLTDGIEATAEVLLDQSVSALVLEEGSRGYSASQPISVFVQSPQECGGLPSGVRATGSAAVDAVANLAAVPSGGPYAANYPPGSVSANLLQLLPITLRPTRIAIKETSSREEGRGASYYFALPVDAPYLAGVGGSDASSTGAQGPLALADPRRIYGGALPKKTPFARDPTFGPLGASPVSREVSLSEKDYLAFAASGAVCTSIMRTLLVPIDNSKTLMQSNPARYPALPEALQTLWTQGRLARLYSAADVAAVSGLLLGGCGFGLNEFLRRYLTEVVGTQAATLYPVQISISAALGSVVGAALATCPFEVLRIRALQTAAVAAETAAAVSQASGVETTSSVRQRYGGGLGVDQEGEEVAVPLARYDVVRGLGTLYGEGGLPLIYSALGPLLLREMPFTITKFLVFDATTQAISLVIPSAQEGPLSSALLSLAGGLVAGVIAAAISTPADTLLTLTQSSSDDNDPPTMLEALAASLQGNPLDLFRGLAPRCVFFGALIAGQFLLYDQCKQLFGVGMNDLTYVLDVFSDRLSFYQ